MKELMNRILEAEKQAQQVVSEAKIRASEIQRKTDEEINQKKSEVKKAGRDTVTEKVDEARKKAASLKADPLPEDRPALLHELGVTDSLFQETVQDVIAVLTQPELDDAKHSAEYAESNPKTKK